MLLWQHAACRPTLSAFLEQFNFLCVISFALVLLILHNFHICMYVNMLLLFWCALPSGVFSIHCRITALALWHGPMSWLKVDYYTLLCDIFAYLWVCMWFLCYFLLKWNWKQTVIFAFFTFFRKLFEKLAFNWFVSCCAWVLLQEAANFFYRRFLLHFFLICKIVGFLN